MRCVLPSNRPVSGRRLLCAATLTLIAVASPGVAQNRVNLEARADADVQGGAPDVNYGDATFIHIGNPDKTVFVWFDLASIPADAVIERARLVMTVAGSGTGPNDVTVGAVRARWEESVITYANQPEVAWSQRTETVNGGGRVSWNVKPAVEAWLAGEHDNYGLALRGDGPIWGFQAREGASPGHRPRLWIQYTTTGAASADASWDVKTPVELHSRPDTTSADGDDENEGRRDR